MINKVTLIGNTGQAPELRRLENGTTVARLTVATNENYKDKDGNWQKQTEWHTVTAWRDLAERCENFRKGELLYVEGKITYRKYKDKDGIDKTACEIVASTIRQLTPKELNLPAQQNDPFAHIFPEDAQVKPAPLPQLEDLPF